MIWEYKKEITQSGIITEEKLNALGSDGWENYAVAGNVYLFKRVAEKIADPALRAAFNGKIVTPPIEPEDRVMSDGYVQKNKGKKR